MQFEGESLTKCSTDALKLHYGKCSSAADITVMSSGLPQIVQLKTSRSFLDVAVGGC